MGKFPLLTPGKECRETWAGCAKSTKAHGDTAACCVSAERAVELERTFSEIYGEFKTHVKFDANHSLSNRWSRFRRPGWCRGPDARNRRCWPRGSERCHQGRRS